MGANADPNFCSPLVLLLANTQITFPATRRLVPLGLSPARPLHLPPELGPPAGGEGPSPVGFPASQTSDGFQNLRPSHSLFATCC